MGVRATKKEITEIERDYVLFRSLQILRLQRARYDLENRLIEKTEEHDPNKAALMANVSHERKDLIRRLKIFIRELDNWEVRVRDILSWQRLYELEIKHFKDALK